MYLEPIEFTLKNGKKAIIRTPLPEDAASMVEYLNVTAAETPFLARCPEDCDRYTVGDEIKVFENAVKADNRLMLVCVLDGKVIGNCEISWKTHIKTMHRAGVGIAILKDYWNQGLGSKFFEIMFETAKNKNIWQVELHVMDDNLRGQALYKKMGFEVVGKTPNFSIYKGENETVSHPHDAFLMTKILK